MKKIANFLLSFVGSHGQGIDREISLDVKTGVEAKNYDDVSMFYWVENTGGVWKTRKIGPLERISIKDCQGIYFSNSSKQYS